VTLGDRLDAILEELPTGWTEARLVLTVPDAGQADAAALILGSLSPGRAGSSFHLRVAAAGHGGPSPDATRRVLARLEREGIDARLAAPEAEAVSVTPRAEDERRRGLAETWDELAVGLPDDWSDLYLEVELGSSDDLERAALLLGPVNPLLREGQRPALRFRAAHRYGYGAAPQMVRRVLARLDEDGIAGRLRLLRVQSDVSPVHTQGLVWREAGRAT
jgi:hypothetical protein